MFFQRVDETGFTESRFSDDEHDLSHPLLRLFPAIGEQANFGIAPSQRRQ